jgi:hypothetical protein
MDVSTVKTIPEKSEAAPDSHPAERQTDAAFLQLLAALGLTPQPIPQVDSNALGEGGDAQADAAAMKQSVLALLQQSTIPTIQSDALGGGSAQDLCMNGGKIDLEAMVKDFLAEHQGAPQAGTAVSDQGAPDHIGAQANAADTASIQVHSADAKITALEGEPSSTTPNAISLQKESPFAATTAETQARERLLHDRPNPDRIALLSGNAPSQQHPPNIVTQLSNPQDAQGKDASQGEHSMTWNAAIELQELSGSAKEKHADAAEHPSWKGDSSQPPAGIDKTLLAPAVAPVSPPSEPLPVRFVSALASVQNIPALAAESPLSPSVRFEVHPDDMGRVRVHLSVVDHTVYTNVMTERVEAHDFLLRNSERFEAGLATHGLDVGRFQVDVQTQGRDHPRDGSAWSRGEGPRHADEPSRSLDKERQPQQRPLMEWDHRMVNLFA